MKRMYGEFQLTSEYGPPGQEVYESDRRRRSGNGLGGSVSATAGFAGGGGSSYFNNKARSARQAGGGLRTPTVNSSSDTGRYVNKMIPRDLILIQSFLTARI